LRDKHRWRSLAELVDLERDARHVKTSTDETWGELHVVSRGQLVQARTWHEGPSSRCSGVASPVLGLDVAHAREDMVIETGQGFDSTEWGRAYFHGPVETPHSLSHGGGPEIARRRPDEVKPPKERLGDQEVNTVQAGGPGGYLAGCRHWCYRLRRALGGTRVVP